MALAAFIAPIGGHAQSPTPSTAIPSSSPSPAPTPDLALVQQFEAFFNDVLAGRTPTQYLTSQMRSAMTPAALAPVQQYYASLGTLSQFQYLYTDQLGAYRRYHFMATFSNGSQKVMFVLDPGGEITGFFDE
ncbi:MAG TPA: hypothetical protein VN936_11695 [Candidatus Acidoferrum sp.]|nr:hypothetical protein [Candidatus Acidoferrum sp.]